MGNYIFQKVKNLKEKYPDIITDFRGKGLLQGIEFKIELNLLSI